MKKPDLRIFRRLTIAAIVLLGLISVWETYHYVWLRTTIIADGKEITVRSKPVTVEAILARNGIRLDRNDLVEPPLSDPMPRRGSIRVLRVDEKSATEKEVLPFIVRWRERYSRNLRPVELQRGTLKTKVREVRTVYHDGEPVTRTVVRERLTKKTVYRLVLLNRFGGVEKTYDLSQMKKIDMIATAYYPGDPLAWRDGTITFLGQKMQRGIVAVDPHVIPLRTRVFVPGYGYGYAGDTGSAIKKKRIDLGVNNAEEEKDFMHRPVTVYLLEKADSW